MLKYLFGVAGLVFGFLFCVLIVHFDWVQSTFFDIALSDIIEILIIGFLSIYLGYYYNRKENNNDKKYSLVMEYLNDIKMTIEVKENEIITSLNDKTIENKNFLLQILRGLSNKIDIINKIKYCDSSEFDEHISKLIEHFSTLKIKISGDDWEIKKDYSQIEIIEIERLLKNICQSTDYIKYLVVNQLN